MSSNSLSSTAQVYGVKISTQNCKSKDVITAPTERQASPVAETYEPGLARNGSEFAAESLTDQASLDCSQFLRNGGGLDHPRRSSAAKSEEAQRQEAAAEKEAPTKHLPHLAVAEAAEALEAPAALATTRCGLSPSAGAPCGTPAGR